MLLPAREQRVELGGRLLPLRLRGILGGERLCLLDDAGALGDRLAERGLRLGLLLLGQLLRGARERLESPRQGVEIADGVGVGDRAAEVRDRLGDVGRKCAAPDPLLQQSDLAGEIGVLALEVGQRLLGGACLPGTDHLLAVGGTHVHGPRLVDAAPRVAAHSASST